MVKVADLFLNGYIPPIFEHEGWILVGQKSLNGPVVWVLECFLYGIVFLGFLFVEIQAFSLRMVFRSSLLLCFWRAAMLGLLVYL